ncbi:MAG: hypothetical protein PHW14_03045 [Candidatus Omnitrophica bacterium]|nr:hypothetical protein [Candidatus Omnitrophota bacterium]
MKRLLLLFVFVLMVSGAERLVSADNDHMFTRKLLNGRFLTALDERTAGIFVQGVIDGIGKAMPGDLGRIYPGMNRDGVVNGVIGFYRNNPGKIDLPVAEVVVSGKARP